MPSSPPQAPLPLDAAAAAAGCAAGAAVFPGTLAAAQLLVLRPLRVQAHQRLWASLWGAAAVGAAGVAASAVCMAVARHPEWLGRPPLPPRSSAQPPASGAAAEAAERLLWATAAGCLFLSRGGRFWRLAPSSLRHVGAFAQPDMPAASREYASAAVRQMLNALGRTHGCHSCGRRSRRTVQLFHGDHQPPNALVKPGQPQRYYPQCNHCSARQGSSLMPENRAGRTPLVTHAAKLRSYHLWLPVGPVLTVVLGLTSLQPHSAEHEQGTGDYAYHVGKAVAELARLASAANWPALAEKAAAAISSAAHTVWMDVCQALDGLSRRMREALPAPPTSQDGRYSILSTGSGSGSSGSGSSGPSVMDTAFTINADTFLTAGGRAVVPLDPQALQAELSRALALPEEKVLSVSAGVGDVGSDPRMRRWRATSPQALLEEMQMLEAHLQRRAAGGGMNGATRGTDGYEQDLREDDAAMASVAVLFAARDAAAAEAARASRGK